MPVDIRPGSPYYFQAVCECPGGGGYQGLAPECCATAAPVPQPEPQPAPQPEPQTDPPAGQAPDTGVFATQTTTAAPAQIVETTTPAPVPWYKKDVIGGIKMWMLLVACILVACFCCVFMMLMLMM